MMNKLMKQAAACGIALVLGVAPAFAQQAQQQSHDMSGHSGHGTAGMQMTGDADLDFATMMRSHHQAGIDMAKTELQNGKDKQMREMAQKIVDAQTKEIAKLDAWIAKRKEQSR
ncbi:DUF305 domain-containing protein [Massilia sp. YMA4]|uniref:DUF305 domain-containing protein n=1 Tax=[Empedobacter] haloabium TaxID=592317 RepID=A0ABZ1URM4_9BURK|nr:DUF305 domain-containing protein [Massilia sp. YMA4]